MMLRRILVSIVLGCYLGTSSGVALARVVGTDEYLAATGPSATARGADLARVMSVLDREDVREQLEALGVDPAEARDRAAALSDRELRQMAVQFDEMPAGGDGLLAVLGIVFVVLIVLDLLGVTHVFTRHG